LTGVDKSITHYLNLPYGVPYMNPFSIINPIAKILLSSRRRTQVVPNKKKKDQSRKNKKWKKDVDKSFMYGKRDK